MPQLNIADLRADTLDRLDNAVQAAQLSEPQRSKLRGTKRVTYAMNEAFSLFVRDADPEVLADMQEVATLSADTSVGSSGVTGNVKVYKWPDSAYSIRRRGGLLQMILEGAEYEPDLFNQKSLETLRHIADSLLYGADYHAFRVDFDNRRIYTPKDLAAKARIIKEPTEITTGDAYGSGGPATLPVPSTFKQSLSQMAFQELIKMGQNPNSRANTMLDTATDVQPEQEES